MDVDLKKVQTNEVEPQVPIRVLRKITANLKDKPDNYKLNFTYIMTACFPTVFKNIMSYCKDCYMQGYLQGKEDAKNESQGRGI